MIRLVFILLGYVVFSLLPELMTTPWQTRLQQKPEEACLVGAEVGHRLRDGGIGLVDEGPGFRVQLLHGESGLGRFQVHLKDVPAAGPEPREDEGGGQRDEQEVFGFDVD